ncbi:MAG: hypothetical protein BWY66_02108 [bacterium ADurb.Bin374]|nr:MAG: hypothetical protein BWY66_02108 [bacterium ADurb.Bin374]
MVVDTCVMAGDDNGKPLGRDREQLVQRAFVECGIGVHDRHAAAKGDTGRDRSHVLLADAHFDEPVGVAQGDIRQAAGFLEVGIEDEKHLPQRHRLLQSCHEAGGGRAGGRDPDRGWAGRRRHHRFHGVCASPCGERVRDIRIAEPFDELCHHGQILAPVGDAGVPDALTTRRLRRHPGQRGPVSLDRFCDHDRRAATLGGGFESLVERPDGMAVAGEDAQADSRQKAVPVVGILDLRALAVGLEKIPVDDGNAPRQSKPGVRQHRFEHLPLLEFAVTEEHVAMMRNARAAPGEGKSERFRQPLAERAAVGVDAWNRPIAVGRQAGNRLVFEQFFDRKEAAGRENGILRHRRVAFRQDHQVAAGRRQCGVANAQVVENGEDLDRREAGAEPAVVRGKQPCECVDAVNHAEFVEKAKPAVAGSIAEGVREPAHHVSVDEKRSEGTGRGRVMYGVHATSITALRPRAQPG